MISQRADEAAGFVSHQSAVLAVAPKVPFNLTAMFVEGLAFLPSLAARVAVSFATNFSAIVGPFRSGGAKSGQKIDAVLIAADCRC